MLTWLRLEKDGLSTARRLVQTESVGVLHAVEGSSCTPLGHDCMNHMIRRAIALYVYIWRCIFCYLTQNPIHPYEQIETGRVVIPIKKFGSEPLL